MAVVAVFGIPIVSDREVPYDLCKKGLTDNPRQQIMQLMRNEVEVLDLGELTIEHSAVRKDDYYELGKKAKELYYDYKGIVDAFLIFGGNHAGALPFYSISGLDIWADAHRDAYSRRKPGPSSIDCGTYMYFVPEIKDERDVWNVGLNGPLVRWWGKNPAG